MNSNGTPCSGRDVVLLSITRYPADKMQLGVRFSKLCVWQYVMISGARSAMNSDSKRYQCSRAEHLKRFVIRKTMTRERGSSRTWNGRSRRGCSRSESGASAADPPVVIKAQPWKTDFVCPWPRITTQNSSLWICNGILVWLRVLHRYCKKLRAEINPEMVCCVVNYVTPFCDQWLYGKYRNCTLQIYYILYSV